MHWLFVFLKGMAMGAADVVPGVSGGTIAFITGIYERLIQAIRSINITWIKAFFSGQWALCWQRADGTFLLVLLAGIVSSIVLLARIVSWLLEHQPILTWSFFFGLIIASSLFIVRQIRVWDAGEVLLLVLGVVVAVFIGMARPASVEVTPLYALLCGSIAICAMILPGISGSFILVLLGAYAAVLQAVHQVDLTVLLPFVAGCGLGLLGFAHLLGWLLDHVHDRVLAVLTGFLVGSLYLIWPWKEVVRTYQGSSGELKPLEQVNISPGYFAEITGQDAQLLWAVLLAVAGVVLVLGLEKMSTRTTVPAPAE